MTNNSGFAWVSSRLTHVGLAYSTYRDNTYDTIPKETDIAPIKSTYTQQNWTSRGPTSLSGVEQALPLGQGQLLGPLAEGLGGVDIRTYHAKNSCRIF